MEAAQQQAERMRHAIRNGSVGEKGSQPYIGELPSNHNGAALSLTKRNHPGGGGGGLERGGRGSTKQREIPNMHADWLHWLIVCFLRKRYPHTACEIHGAMLLHASGTPMSQSALSCLWTLLAE